MTTIRRKCSLLLLSRTYTFIFFSTPSSSCFLASKVQVHIINDLPKTSRYYLRLHCKSKDDLGYHNLKPDQEYEFKFCKKPFSTLFFCNLWWGHKKKGFHAYSASFDWHYCTDSSHCVWVAQEKGTYNVRLLPQPHLEFAFAWENNVLI